VAGAPADPLKNFWVSSKGLTAAAAARRIRTSVNGARRVLKLKKPAELPMMDSSSRDPSDRRSFGMFPTRYSTRSISPAWMALISAA